jgi:hypothetical protein
VTSLLPPGLTVANKFESPNWKASESLRNAIEVFGDEEDVDVNMPFPTLISSNGDSLHSGDSPHSALLLDEEDECSRIAGGYSSAHFSTSEIEPAPPREKSRSTQSSNFDELCVLGGYGEEPLVGHVSRNPRARGALKATHPMGITTSYLNRPAWKLDLTKISARAKRGASSTGNGRKESTRSARFCGPRMLCRSIQRRCVTAARNMHRSFANGFRWTKKALGARNAGDAEIAAQGSCKSVSNSQNSERDPREGAAGSKKEESSADVHAIGGGTGVFGPPARPLAELVGGIRGDDFFGLVGQLLAFDPAKRPTAEAALNHVYFKA